MSFNFQKNWRILPRTKKNVGRVVGLSPRYFLCKYRYAIGIVDNPDCRFSHEEGKDCAAMAFRDPVPEH